MPAKLVPEPLTPEEREEFDRLFSAANEEAIRQYCVLVHPEMAGKPLRPLLESLRDGTWRRRIEY